MYGCMRRVLLYFICVFGKPNAASREKEGEKNDERPIVARALCELPLLLPAQQHVLSLLYI